MITRKTALLILLCLILFLGLLQAQDLTLNGTDPTETRHRFDMNIAEAKFTSLGDYMGIRISGDLAPMPDFSVGAGIPFYYADLPDGKVYGIGDVKLSGLFQVHHSKSDESAYRRTAIGLNLSAPSGDHGEGMGRGAFAIDGYIAASYFLGDFYMIAPVLETTQTFAEESNSDIVHDISLRMVNTFSLSDGHWVEITPEIFWDLRGELRPLYVISSTLGIMLDKRWALATDFTTPLAGDADFNSIGRLSVRYLF